MSGNSTFSGHLFYRSRRVVQEFGGHAGLDERLQHAGHLRPCRSRLMHERRTRLTLGLQQGLKFRAIAPFFLSNVLMLGIMFVMRVSEHRLPPSNSGFKVSADSDPAGRGWTTMAKWVLPRIPISGKTRIEIAPFDRNSIPGYVPDVRDAEVRRAHRSSQCFHLSRRSVNGFGVLATSLIQLPHNGVFGGETAEAIAAGRSRRQR